MKGSPPMAPLRAAASSPLSCTFCGGSRGARKINVEGMWTSAKVGAVHRHGRPAPGTSADSSTSAYTNQRVSAVDINRCRRRENIEGCQRRSASIGSAVDVNR